MRYHRVVGIDFGMTNSVVSLWDYEKQEFVAIPNPVNQLTTIPSVVSQAEGSIIVGTNARENSLRDPENTIVEIKRFIGAYESETNTAPNTPHGTPKRVHFNGREWLPQEILALILSYLKTVTEKYIGGEPVNDAVLTVPTYFREAQKVATVEAAQMAHLNVKILLNEPVAAAIGFGVDKDLDEQEHFYMVYDLGGRTLDVSIISCSNQEIRVVATAGNPHLGGDNFDNCIVDYVIRQIQNRCGIDLFLDPKVLARIKQVAELCKRELSLTDSTTLDLPYLTPQLSVNIPLHCSTFESLINSKLKESLTHVDQAIELAKKSDGVNRHDIERVLLVGGSTRIANVRSMIADHMKFDIAKVRADVDPTEVVSRGAAILALRWQPSIV